MKITPRIASAVVLCVGVYFLVVLLKPLLQDGAKSALPGIVGLAAVNTLALWGILHQTGGDPFAGYRAVTKRRSADRKARRVSAAAARLENIQIDE